VDKKEFLYKQRPLKEKYRSEPGSSRITLRARGSQTDAPISCSVDIGRAVYEAQAHAGVGGPGTAACSGDLLLGVSKDVPVGFERIRTRFDVVAPEATEEQLDALRRKTEQYCVVFQTLARPPELETEWV
jgi:OsmC-like protein